jgi:hypothetical protein
LALIWPLTLLGGFGYRLLIKVPAIKEGWLEARRRASTHIMWQGVLTLGTSASIGMKGGFQGGRQPALAPKVGLTQKASSEPEARSRPARLIHRET